VELVVLVNDTMYLAPGPNPSRLTSTLAMRRPDSIAFWPNPRSAHCLLSSWLSISLPPTILRMAAAHCSSALSRLLPAAHCSSALSRLLPAACPRMSSDRRSPSPIQPIWDTPPTDSMAYSRDLGLGTKFILLAASTPRPDSVQAGLRPTTMADRMAPM